VSPPVPKDERPSLLNVPVPPVLPEPQPPVCTGNEVHSDKQITSPILATTQTKAMGERLCRLGIQITVSLLATILLPLFTTADGIVFGFDCFSTGAGIAYLIATALITITAVCSASHKIKAGNHILRYGSLIASLAALILVSVHAAIIDALYGYYIVVVIIAAFTGAQILYFFYTMDRKTI
jgi:hypothetical protein